MAVRGLASRMLLALTGVLGLFAVVMPTASADPGFIDGPPDKGLHTWCYHDVGSLQTVMDASMTRLRDQTVVDTAYHPSCTAHTDVRWVQGPTPYPDYIGWTECKVWNENYYCDRYRVTLYKGLMDQTPNPSAQYDITACHELGHSVGVSHYNSASVSPDYPTQSCMRNSYNATGATWERQYGSHHRTAHINPWFS